jgi:hypothetical protein
MKSKEYEAMAGEAGGHKGGDLTTMNLGKHLFYLLIGGCVQASSSGLRGVLKST